MRATDSQTDSRPLRGALLPWTMAGLLGLGLVASLYEARVARMEERTAALQRLLEERRQAAPEPRVIAVPMPMAGHTAPAAQATAPHPAPAPVQAPAAAAPAPAPRPAAAPEVQEKTEDIETTAAPEANHTQAARRPIPEAERSQAHPAPEAPARATTVMAAAPVKGRVIVSQPRQKRLMLDVGGADEVQPGMRFTLWRNGVYVGELRVETVFAGMSACEVVSVSGSGVRIGDAARAVEPEVALAPPREP